MAIPSKKDFPAGTAFMIKEFDIPLARVPEGNLCKWFNWYGGKPRPYPIENLRPGNNWPASSFEEWAALVRDSVNA